MKQSRNVPALLLLALLSLALAVHRVQADPFRFLREEDWIFGEGLLPCQYRSPPGSACHRYRRCRKVGGRWLCSRWLERKRRQHGAGRLRHRRHGRTGAGHRR